MKYITKITITTFAALLLALPFSVPAFADINSACSGQNDSTADKNLSACQTGYNNPSKNFCAPLPANQQTICNNAADQALKDQQAAGGTGQSGAGTGAATTPPKTGSCGGATTEIVTCDQAAGVGAIGSLIRTAVIILTILIGVVAVGGITYAAILYASAQNNQSQTQQAIGIIRNIVIGLVLYGLMVAIVNWLIPGGAIG